MRTLRGKHHAVGSFGLRSTFTLGSETVHVDQPLTRHQLRDLAMRALRADAELAREGFGEHDIPGEGWR